MAGTVNISDDAAFCWKKWGFEAFRAKVRLIGWPINMGTMPGPTYNRNKYNYTVLFALLQRLEKAESPTSNNDDDDEEVDDMPLLSVVPWDEGESLAIASVLFG